MVGLGSVDNTSDANKPISTAQAAGLAPKANPIFTGTVNASKISLTDEIEAVFNISNQSFIDIIDVDATFGRIKLGSLPEFADNTAAAALPTGVLYRTSTGVLMVKY